jgi:hypothetical protein
MDDSKNTVVAPVELCEKEKTPKEASHSGHKVITSVAGGITAVGVLLIFLQLRYFFVVQLVPFPSESSNASTTSSRSNKNNSAIRTT